MTCSARGRIDGRIVMTISPNVRYQDYFLKLQPEAQEQKRGLWADPGLQTGPGSPTLPN
jgi:endonuclease YncB( thermonuclease family)